MSVSPPVAPLRLDPAKFRDPQLTARGEARASVALAGLRTLWLNTGTLCNVTCRNCYIESSPRNDALVYLTAAECRTFLEEIERDALPVEEIGFTGGEPFLNRDLPAMLEEALARGHRALVLTNAMKPMRNQAAALLALRDRYGDRLTLRVSLDHYGALLHDLERQDGSFAVAIEGLAWLAQNGFRVNVAGRAAFGGEGEAALRAGFAALFADRGIPVDAADPVALMLFPEMDAAVDVPEITTACWGLLRLSPESLMCASSRMVVKRRGAARPAVVACTLLPYDPQFELGGTLAEASRPVALNHPHCARFCVLGGAACSR
ncbi:radical SAM protein [Paeniroseomonas aquatica]|uniref:Radical SAM protein n=1 Tax=Paeniroseomonas aquatica TaxID=373043 RepID=A0ABT8AA54_9PROT|nr:radical SAM protein [Paeniroseomonas aquatica]MDN3566595.1 radical SAM protein [Paeniroseomonas aquatica]